MEIGDAAAGGGEMKTRCRLIEVWGWGDRDWGRGSWEQCREVEVREGTRRWGLEAESGLRPPGRWKSLRPRAR